MFLPPENGTWWIPEHEYKLMEKMEECFKRARAKALWSDPQIVIKNGGIYSYTFQLMYADPEWPRSDTGINTEQKPDKNN